MTKKKKILILFLIPIGILIVFGLLLYYFVFSKSAWDKAINSAFKPNDCKEVVGPKYGDKIYEGPLIDSHYHIADLSIPVIGELADPNDPVLGQNLTIPDVACTLKQEGTKKVFAFFPVYPEIYKQHIEVAKRTMKKYPDTFVPFIMPPEHDDSKDGFPTVDAEFLAKMLAVEPNLFKGFGEIGLYKREDGAPELPPNSERLKEIYKVIRKEKMPIYFHLGEGQKESFEKTLDENPDLNFIWHGDQLVKYGENGQDLSQIEEIIKNHKNVFYTVDELYGDQWMLRPEVTKQEFLNHLENYKELIPKDLATWKGIIERHPDQFMWGTDRLPQTRWNHDPDVGQALANYGRLFIANLDPTVQEKFAYKNAEKSLK